MPTDVETSSKLMHFYDSEVLLSDLTTIFNRGIQNFQHASACPDRRHACSLVACVLQKNAGSLLKNVPWLLTSGFSRAACVIVARCSKQPGSRHGKRCFGDSFGFSVYPFLLSEAVQDEFVQLLTKPPATHNLVASASRHSM